MAEPENHTLHLLRDIRDALAGIDRRLDGLDAKVDRNQGDLRSRMDNIRQALNGENVLGRYAAAEVEERLEAIENRLSELEKVR